MKPSKLFCYGILKRGFNLDLECRYTCNFLGEAIIRGANLYAIGGGAGLRFSDDPLQVVHGEIFEIPDQMWPWLDSIENNGKTYTRKVTTAQMDIRRFGSRGKGITDVKCWVYEHTYPGMRYAHWIESGKFGDDKRVE
jgi:gamma-glutamylcyclotransferase (GGCT)/AIG2-like uncharacterized protein YtfP